MNGVKKIELNQNRTGERRKGDSENNLMGTKGGKIGLGGDKKKGQQEERKGLKVMKKKRFGIPSHRKAGGKRKFESVSTPRKKRNAMEYRSVIGGD